MICTIKQQAYQRYQRPLMRERGLATAAVAYDSFITLKHWLEPEVRSHFGPKQIAPKQISNKANVSKASFDAH